MGTCHSTQSDCIAGTNVIALGFPPLPAACYAISNSNFYSFDDLDGNTMPADETECRDGNTAGTCFTGADCATTPIPAQTTIGGCFANGGQSFLTGDAAPRCLVNSGSIITESGACTANCGGDPHFTTWGGQHWNYHGQCDLILTSSKNFQGGKGLDVHVRTKHESIYSIVSGVGIQVGDTTLEFSQEVVGEHKFYVNKTEVAVEELPYQSKEFAIIKRIVLNEELNVDITYYDFDLGHGTMVTLEVWHQWVMVFVDSRNKDMIGSKGLFGSFPEGKMLGRDGVTDLSGDRSKYGSEWQVQPGEPMLFHSMGPKGHPQAPHEGCRLPEVTDSHRFLRHDRPETYKMAMEMCLKEGVAGVDLDDCIFDVSMLNNPKYAALWWGKEQEEVKHRAKVQDNVKPVEVVKLQVEATQPEEAQPVKATA